MRLLEFLCGPLERAEVIRVKEDEAAQFYGLCRLQRIDGGGHGYVRSLADGIPECAGRDCRKGEGIKSMLIGQTNRFAMAVRQRLGLALLSAAIDWAHGVDHMLRGKSPARCNHGLPSGQPSDLADDLPALGENGRSSSAMNCPIHAAFAA